MRTLHAILATLLSMAGGFGCSEDRDVQPMPGGVHPPGWAEKGNPAFHAEWLKANGFPLPRCQQCHGADYAGGPVAVSCSQGSCHQAGPPTACTTCHGADGSPRPKTGAHYAHQAFCDTCHTVPTTDQVQQHASAGVDAIVRFKGLAAQGGAQPSWDRDAQRCSNTYCHGALSPQWSDPTPITCDACHKAPPDDHARWSRLVTGTDSCKTCHPAPTEPTHVNGTVNLTVTDCTTCHGSNGHPNPPVALDGATDPSARGVGAHLRHLDEALPDRIAKPLACETCHDVPATVVDPVHFQGPAAKVRFVFGGSYDTATATCNVWCHFNKTPGPTWTDATGDARQCNSCHEFPPKVTRAGTPHPTVAGDLSQCQLCHVWGPSTHVNGVVDFIQGGASP